MYVSEHVSLHTVPEPPSMQCGERRDISALVPCCRTACIRDLIVADDALGASRSSTLGHTRAIPPPPSCCRGLLGL